MAEPIRVEHIRVAKTARYYIAGSLGRDTRAVWLVCHGYGQLAGRFLERFARIAVAGRVVIAPEALHRFYLDPMDRSAAERRVGATWMTREDRLTDIADYVEYLDLVCQHTHSEIGHAPVLVGLGFSQGTATIMRWAAATEQKISRLVLWGAGVPPDLDWDRAEERLHGVPVTLAVGNQDPFAAPERLREQEELLAAHGMICDTLRYEGGHRIEPAVLEKLAAL